jgi:uncharacterized membrane protein YagU involved in acid resistance
MLAMRVLLFASGSDPWFHRLFKGVLMGFLATVPMSLSMLLGRRLLPRQERYGLPPRLITEEITERVGIRDHLGEDELMGLTIFSHFGYGAMTGGLYALVEPLVPLHASLKGALAGIAVWVGSYLGWLPAMDILPPATQHPWRRNLLMLVAHAIWGAALGEGLRKLAERD